MKSTFVQKGKKESKFPKLMVSTETGNIYLISGITNNKATGIVIYENKNYCNTIYRTFPLGYMSSGFDATNLVDFSGEVTLKSE